MEVAPQEVPFDYRKVGDTHIYSSDVDAMTGLVHVGHHNNNVARSEAIAALELHVKTVYGQPAKYAWDGDRLAAIRKGEA